jgi:hypothetical protein
LKHTMDCHAEIERAARHGAYGRIHAGGITPAGQDRNMFHTFKSMTECARVSI